MVRCTFFFWKLRYPAPFHLGIQTMGHFESLLVVLLLPFSQKREVLLFAFSQKPTLFLDFLSVLQLSSSHIAASNPSREELVQILPYYQGRLRQSQNKPNSGRSGKMKPEGALKWEVLSSSWAACRWWEMFLSTTWCKHCQAIRINEGKLKW